MLARLTHYDTLRIQRTDPPEVIKRAYRKLSSEFHPDHNPGQDATAKMQEINAAYAVLGDPVARATYDAEMGFSSSAFDAKMAAFDAKMAELAAQLAAVMAAARAAAAVDASFGRRTQQEPPKPSPTADVPKPQPMRAKPAKTSPKRKPKAKPEKATEPTAEQQAEQQANLEALRVEARKLCSTPPEFIRGDAGVLAVRKWKKVAAKWCPVAYSKWATIETLTAARKAMLQAAEVQAG
jgi:curved DNA-binding protein CbpA